MDQVVNITPGTKRYTRLTYITHFMAAEVSFLDAEKYFRSSYI